MSQPTASEPGERAAPRDGGGNDGDGRDPGAVYRERRERFAAARAAAARRSRHLSWARLAVALAALFLLLAILLEAQAPPGWAFAALALAVAAAVGGRVGWHSRNLLVAAVALRILGSTVRHEILFRYYSGFGDAVRYYVEGLELANWIRALQLNPFTLGYWVSGEKWWGTFFLIKSSGVVLSVIGPSMRGEFLVYSLISFSGIYAISRAVQRLQPGPRSEAYNFWLWLWPSLWFWPASVGKEALLFLAIGLTVLGYVGRGEGIGWPTFLAGVGLAFCIRPHVAAVLAFAAAAAHWLGAWQRLSPRRLAEAALAVAVAIYAFDGMRAQFGLGDADLEGMREFVAFRQGQTEVGGSEIGAVGLSPTGVAMALVNVWLRPFPWDAHNLTSAFAAVEMLLVWWLLWKRRRAVLVALKAWRRHRLLRFGLPFLVVYSLMIGLTFANLGILARQRTPILPFLLLVLLAAPDPAVAQAPVPRPAERPASPASPPRRTPRPSSADRRGAAAGTRAVIQPPERRRRR